MNQALTAPQASALLDEIDLGSAKGGLAGQNKKPLELSVVRSLGEADLPLILNPPPVAASAPVVKSIRASHHKLAQLIAEGKPGTEISLITGYSQSYISTLQGDPAFEELIAYYAEQQRQIFINTQERLQALGHDAVEKLHETLHDPAQVWSKREIMEVIKLALPVETSPKPVQGPAVSVSAEGASLEIKFVGAKPAGGPVVDAQFSEVPSGPGK